MMPLGHATIPTKGIRFISNADGVGRQEKFVNGRTTKPQPLNRPQCQTLTHAWIEIAQSMWLEILIVIVWLVGLVCLAITLKLDNRRE